MDAVGENKQHAPYQLASAKKDMTMPRKPIQIHMYQSSS